MTCILALKWQGKIYMGGDAAAVSGCDILNSLEPKIFNLVGPGGRKILIGYTSSFRMGQIIQYEFQPPISTPYPNDDMHYLISEFIPTLRLCLKENGFSKVENNEESGGQFLIGYKSEIYKVWDDFHIFHPYDGFISCGAGEDYAMGALAAIIATIPKEAGNTPDRWIIQALTIAEHFSNVVRHPFTVNVIGENE